LAVARVLVFVIGVDPEDLREILDVDRPGIGSIKTADGIGRRPVSGDPIGQSVDRFERHKINVRNIDPELGSEAHGGEFVFRNVGMAGRGKLDDPVAACAAHRNGETAILAPVLQGREFELNARE